MRSGGVAAARSSRQAPAGSANFAHGLPQYRAAPSGRRPSLRRTATDPRFSSLAMATTRSSPASPKPYSSAAAPASVAYPLPHADGSSA